MIKLQRLTGMRPGEVTIMRGRDLDMTGKVWVYTPATHKTAVRCWDAERENAARLSARETLLLTAIGFRTSTS